MKCRQFQKAVADYVGGRLDVPQAQAMDDHKAVCATCARSCAREHVLRQSFQAVSLPTPLPDVWPQLAAQLQAPPAVAGRPFAYGRVWGGALCGVSACAVFLSIGLLPRPAPQVDSDLAQPFSAAAVNRPLANDTIIGLVGDMRDRPDTETEASWAEDAYAHQEKRSLLLGEHN